MALPAFVFSWAIQYVVGEIADSGKGVDAAAVKAKINAELATKVHSAWLVSEAGKDLGMIIDAALSIAQDQPAMAEMLGDLAAKNWPAAEKKLLAEVAIKLPQLSGLLASL